MAANADTLFRPNNTPTCNILRSVYIRVKNTTRCAIKLLFISLALFSTTRTSHAGISGINKLNLNPNSSSLITNHGLKFSKTPTRFHSVQMLVPNFGSSTNVLQVLHPNQTNARTQTLLNQRFGEIVVLPGYSPCFSARKPLQKILRTFCVFALKRSSYPVPLLFEFLSTFPRNQTSFGSCNGVHNSHINSQNLISFDWLWGFFFHVDVNKPNLPISLKCGGSGFLSSQMLSLIFSQTHWNVNSTIDSGQGNTFISFSILKNSCIIVNTGRLEHLWKPTKPFCSDQCLRHTPDGSDHQIGRQRSCLPEFLITQSMKFNVIRFIVFECNWYNSIASLGEFFASVNQSLIDSGIGYKFALNSEHIFTIIHKESVNSFVEFKNFGNIFAERRGGQFLYRD